MKIQPSTIFAVATLVAAISTVFVARGQQPTVAARYEVATVKWDGPDRLQFLTPQKSESIRLFKTGVQLPPEIRDEEFCLTWAANKMAMDGWEPVNINSTRILFKRPVIR